MSEPRLPALADDILQALASNTPAETVPEAASTRILDTLNARIRAEAPDFRFLHQHEGSWIPLTHGVQMKMLRQDADSRSFLLRIAAGASLPAHPHALDEESLVLEGDVTVEGVRCLPGDYHFAPAGKAHSPLYSASGCLLFVRGAAHMSRRK